MRRHADIGHRIVSSIHGLAPATLGCVRHHHECWDGSGYPSGLAARRSRSPRGSSRSSTSGTRSRRRAPTSPRYPQHEVRALLRKGRGERFEPALVDLFLRLLDEEGEELLALAERGAP